jgi:(2Fe-2S) ferredoxin
MMKLHMLVVYRMKWMGLEEYQQRNDLSDSTQIKARTGVKTRVDAVKSAWYRSVFPELAPEIAIDQLLTGRIDRAVMGQLLRGLLQKERQARTSESRA